MLLVKDMVAIERNESRAWHDLAGHDFPPIDAEHGETFGAVCAYLVRRDPVIFLRRHLAGDPQALLQGRAAYERSDEYRSVLDAVYRFRLWGARSVGERALIRDFIAYTRVQDPLTLAA